MKYKVMSGRFETGTQEQKAGFYYLFGNEHIQETFDLYFHWYNIVHEIGHGLLRIHGVTMPSIDEELFVNCFAVAYWQAADRNGNLAKIRRLVERILKNIPSPVPQGMSFRDFYESIWETNEISSVMIYGFFQFTCVTEAFELNKKLPELLTGIGYEHIDLSLMTPYSDDINAENAYKVFQHCINNLKSIGLRISDIDMELVDNPEIQCCLPVS